MRYLNEEDIAAIFRVPPHLIGLKRKRFWRLRGWLRRMSFKVRR